MGDVSRQPDLYSWDGSGSARRQQGDPAQGDLYKYDGSGATQRRNDCDNNSRICKWHPDYSYSSPEARQWLQENKASRNQPLPLDRDGLYTVRHADCLETIAQRELRAEGRVVNSKTTKEEVQRLIQLNREQYPTLDCNPEYLGDGWKIRLRGAPQEPPVRPDLQAAPADQCPPRGRFSAPYDDGVYRQPIDPPRANGVPYGDAYRLPGGADNSYPVPLDRPPIERFDPRMTRPYNGDYLYGDNNYGYERRPDIGSQILGGLSTFLPFLLNRDDDWRGRRYDRYDYDWQRRQPQIYQFDDDQRRYPPVWNTQPPWSSNWQNQMNRQELQIQQLQRQHQHDVEIQQQQQQRQRQHELELQQQQQQQKRQRQHELELQQQQQQQQRQRQHELELQQQQQQRQRQHELELQQQQQQRQRQHELELQQQQRQRQQQQQQGQPQQRAPQGARHDRDHRQD
jgi:hypothetical protein